MLAYSFMQRAVLVGLLLGIVLPLMGVVVIHRRVSTVGDALSHASLAGIGLGLLFGWQPLWGAMLATLIGAFSIEAVRARFPGQGDMATAIVMSTGIGLASILSEKVQTATNFESYLFGSIITVTTQEVWMSFVLSLIVFILFFYSYYWLLHLSVDPRGARLSGVPVRFMNAFYTFLLALTIAVGARALGALMVSSLLILPVACSMQFARSYRSTILWSMVLGVGLVLVGLTLSFYVGLRPSGTIVLLGVTLLLLLQAGRFILQKTR